MSDEKKTPAEWCLIEGVAIADYDGWRGEDAPPWHQPLTREEFDERLARCTVKVIPTPDSGLLTADEHAAVEALAAAWDAVVKVVNAGGNPDTFDSHELVPHLHALQNAVLANAAARAYPDTYRLLGGSSRARG